MTEKYLADPRDVVMERNKALKKYEYITKVLYYDIESTLRSGKLTDEETSRLKRWKRELEHQSSHIEKICQLVYPIEKMDDPPSSPDDEEWNEYMAAQFLAGPQIQMLHFASTFLHLGYLIGIHGSYNPVLERQANQRAEARSRKAEAQSRNARFTRLEKERPEIERRREIVIECARNYLRMNQNKAKSVNYLATQIFPDVSRRCESLGIPTKTVGTIASDLQSDPSVCESLPHREGEAKPVGVGEQIAASNNSNRGSHERTGLPVDRVAGSRSRRG